VTREFVGFDTTSPPSVRRVGAISDIRKMNGCERHCSSVQEGPLQIDDHEGDVVGLPWA
jgi:hypothetical protein